MTTRLPVALALFLVGTCWPVYAQTPDFSGTWVLDESKSLVNGLPRPARAPAPGVVQPPAALSGETSPPGSPMDPAQAPIRITGRLRPPTKIKDVRPVYPPEAMKKRITGMIVIEATIAPDGTVRDAQVLRSIPELDQAALDAVRQWEFTPTSLDGKPVPVIMTVTTNFAIDGVKPVESIPVRPSSQPSLSGSLSSAPIRLTITQDAASLTVTREATAALGPVVTVYPLDGRETRNVNTYPPRGASNQPVEVVWICRSSWDNGKLVSTIVPETASPGGTGPVRRTEARYFEGDAMVVETVTQGPPGAPPLVTKLVYRRAGGAPDCAV